MSKKDEKTAVTILNYRNDKNKCIELVKNYKTKTVAEAIGNCLIDAKLENAVLLDSFYILEELCEMSINSLQGEVFTKELESRERQGDIRDLIKLSEIPLKADILEIRGARVWIKRKVDEIKLGNISDKIPKRLNWNGKREQLYNGFDQLRKIESRGKQCFSATDKDLNSFIDSRFIIKNSIPKNSKYSISWNADKHDLTVLFRELYSENLINNTKSEILFFILETFPDYSFSSLTKYLGAKTRKQKYSLDITIFK